MNDAKRKLLTEYCPAVAFYTLKCFPTLSEDNLLALSMMALKDRLVEKGEFIDFEMWCYIKWDLQLPFNDLSRKLGEYHSWLMHPERFCDLVSDWLESQEGRR